MRFPYWTVLLLSSAEKPFVKFPVSLAVVVLSVFNDGDVHIHGISFDSCFFCFQFVSTNLLCSSIRSVSLYTMLRAMVHRYAGKLFAVSRLLRFSHIAMKLLWVMSLANDLSYTRRIMVLYSFALYFSYSASKANLLPSLNLATNRVSFPSAY